jgi:predicted DNA-binding transcriptional regulator AlpA
MQDDTGSQQDKIYQELRKKYKRMTISKSEMSNELGISNSTLDLYIAKGIGLPNYKKLGTAKNAKVIFNLLDVAEFLANTIKTV